MAYSPILRSDLQDLLDKYMKMRDNKEESHARQKISALHLFSGQQQISLEFERKQTEKMKSKLKSVLCYLTERKDQQKTSLKNLEKENKELKRVLADMRRERDRAELFNATAVSTLQNEIDFLRLQVTQLEDKHEEQLMLLERHHKDEISKYKHLLRNMNTKKLFPEQNVKNRNKLKITEKHPAFVNEERENASARKRSIKKKSISDEWFGENVCKRRKLFHEDKETPIDII